MDEPDVAEAADWLAGRVVRTPVIRSAALDELAGARLWLKTENLQHGGSHKFRGALRAVGRAAANGAPGVIAQSSGNHGIAVAMAAAEFGLPATVVLPIAAEQFKVATIKAHGAETIVGPPSVRECAATVARLRDATGYAFINVRGDTDVIAGLGTASRELIEEVPDLNALVVPAANGSGVAGAVLAARGHDISVYAAEPEACGALRASLRSGRPTTVPSKPTIADALVEQRPGSLPFALMKDAVADSLLVSERDIAMAFRQLLFATKLLVEPAGAAGLAAALSLGGHRDIGVILTGGNIALSMVGRLILDA